MPIACSTKRHYWFSLQTDTEDFPEGERPAFKGRCLTAGEAMELSEKYDQLPVISLDRKINAEVDETFLSAITDWRNVKHPRTGEVLAFSRENISAGLSYQEKRKAILGALVAQNLSEIDLKKSAPQSPSNGEPSAPLVAAVNVTPTLPPGESSSGNNAPIAVDGTATNAASAAVAAA